MRGKLRSMEYDSAFHAVHIEYVRLRWRNNDDSYGARPEQIRAGIANLLSYRTYLTDHGRELLEELDELSDKAGAPVT